MRLIAKASFFICSILLCGAYCFANKLVLRKCCLLLLWSKMSGIAWLKNDLKAALSYKRKVYKIIIKLLR